MLSAGTRINNYTMTYVPLKRPHSHSRLPARVTPHLFIIYSFTVVHLKQLNITNYTVILDEGFEKLHNCLMGTSAPRELVPPRNKKFVNNI